MKKTTSLVLILSIVSFGLVLAIAGITICVQALSLPYYCWECAKAGFWQAVSGILIIISAILVV